jgi:hypothetical protein
VLLGCNTIYSGKSKCFWDVTPYILVKVSATSVIRGKKPGDDDDDDVDDSNILVYSQTVLLCFVLHKEAIILVTVM